MGRHPAGVADRLVCLGGADAGDPVARRSATRSAASAGRRRWPSTWSGSAVFAVAQLWLEAVVTAWTGVVSFPVAQSVRTYFPVLLALGFHGGVLCYWLIIGLQSLWRFHESSRRHEREALELMARASALETQVVQARLGALKMQLQPHFLFNTLNAVVSLVRARRGREAEDTLAHLSDLLRWVLDDSEHAGGAAGARAGVRAALPRGRARALRRSAARRHADRARRAGRRRAAPVPAADRRERDPARHRGERVRRRAGHRARAASAACWSCVVEDDGPGFRSFRQPVGIGLANTRLRLAELYGDRAALTLANALDGGAIVMLTLPFRECEEPAARRARTRSPERRPCCEPRRDARRARRRRRAVRPLRPAPAARGRRGHHQHPRSRQRPRRHRRHGRPPARSRAARRADARHERLRRRRHRRRRGDARRRVRHRARPLRRPRLRDQRDRLPAEAGHRVALLGGDGPRQGAAAGAGGAERAAVQPARAPSPRRTST